MPGCRQSQSTVTKFVAQVQNLKTQIDSFLEDISNDKQTQDLQQFILQAEEEHRAFDNDRRVESEHVIEALKPFGRKLLVAFAETTAPPSTSQAQRATDAVSGDTVSATAPVAPAPHVVQDLEEEQANGSAIVEAEQNRHHGAAASTESPVGSWVERKRYKNPTKHSKRPPTRATAATFGQQSYFATFEPDADAGFGDPDN